MAPKPAEDEEPVDVWKAPVMLVTDAAQQDSAPAEAQVKPVPVRDAQHRGRGGRGGHRPPQSRRPEDAVPKPQAQPRQAAPKSEKPADTKPRTPGKNYHRRSRRPKPKTGGEAPKE